MNRIRILPDNLANQIAAGEVVERPASVVKELVENAIDAGAGRLQIEIELGGRRLMRISDDGVGMERDDSVLAFERHATSKIREADDLGRIETLGFRGEALASIASVARVELLTKTESSIAGTRVEIEGGRLIDVKDAPRGRGTTVSVRDLFFNTPARRKFMRSEATENYHLVSIVTHYALAHPEIAYLLKNNGREIFNLSPAKSLRERAFQLFGTDLVESLLPVVGGREYVAKISGFVSAPRERRTNKDAQYYFVNRRFVRDKVIAAGLREGFRSVLPHGFYPVAFLFLDVPVEEIDVNVHPAKTEIRFRRSEAVKDAIAEAVKEALSRAGVLLTGGTKTIHELDRNAVEEAVVESEDSEAANGTRAAAASPTFGSGTSENADLNSRHIGDFQQETSGTIFTNTDGPLPSVESVDPWMIDKTEQNSSSHLSPATDTGPLAELRSETNHPYPVLPPVASAAGLVKEAAVDSISALKIKPIAQLHESFIIAEDDEGLLLIDQHVAHERILFDKFRQTEADRPVESQMLLLPETVDLPPPQAEVFHLIEDELASLGFGLMRLSGRTVAIKSVPNDIRPDEAKNLFLELLDVAAEGDRAEARSSLRDIVSASLACRAAIKINTPLSSEKMHWLVDRLLMTSSPTTCPHGRPVVLRLRISDVERGFHRT